MCGGWGVLLGGGGIAIDALTCEESDFVLNPGGDREPVKSMADRRDVFMFSHSHQDPTSTVLDVLEPFKSC